MSTDGKGVVSATERLALSRERMRQTMVAVMPQPHRAIAHGKLPHWLETVKSIPGASVLIDAVRGWWAHHPMRMASMVGIEASKTLIRPFAQRHPIGLVAIALLVGGALVWAKPWRGYLKPALLAGLLPQLLSKTMALVPMESWMSILATLTQGPAPQAQAETSAAEDPVAVQASPVDHAAIDPAVLH